MNTDRLSKLEDYCSKLEVPRNDAMDDQIENLFIGDMRGIYDSFLPLIPKLSSFSDSLVKEFNKRFPHLSHKTDAVRGRASRTWPSFVRESHFQLLLEDEFCGLEARIISKRAIDHKGIDFLIILDNRSYGVRTYTNTLRALQKLARKEGSRHIPPPGLPLIDVLFDVPQGNKLKLYEKSDAVTVKSKVLSSKSSGLLINSLPIEWQSVITK